MTIIEKVARAITIARGDDPDAYYSDMGAGWKPWMQYEKSARMAIEAMRSPTEEMINAAHFPGTGAMMIWQRMIEAALKSGPKRLDTNAQTIA